MVVECPVTLACTTVPMCWSMCATVWEPDFPLCGKLHDFTEKIALLDRKQQWKFISVEQRVRLWVFDQNERSSYHCPWLYVFHTYIFISIFWVVTPCLESFAHVACDGKRQEELKKRGVRTEDTPDNSTCARLKLSNSSLLYKVGLS